MCGAGQLPPHRLVLSTTSIVVQLVNCWYIEGQRLRQHCLLIFQIFVLAGSIAAAKRLCLGQFLVHGACMVHFFAYKGVVMLFKRFKLRMMLHCSGI